MRQPLQATFQSHFVAVAGPSGVGKTATIDALISMRPERYVRPVSYTSRPRRPGESSGEYRFVDEAELLSLRDSGLLANVDYVYGHYYAMSSDSITSIFSSGKIAIKEIHADNIEALRHRFPSLISAIILPPEGSGEAIAGRQDREQDDAERYAMDDVLLFDVIYRRSKGESVNNVAKNLDVVLNAVSSTGSFFPRPSKIDAANGIGYELVAPEFTESLRVTTANFHSITRDFFQRTINQIARPDRKCLEIGPGSGWLRRFCEWPKVTYACADISRAMLLHCNERSERSVCATARDLPFPECSFDAVFASLADSYCYPAALCELRRVLRPGGSLVLSSPARDWADGVRDSTAVTNTTQFRLRNGLDATVYSFALSLGELSQLLEICGYEIVEADEARGCLLDGQVAPAVRQAANKRGVSVSDMAIVNCVHARRAMTL